MLEENFSRVGYLPRYLHSLTNRMVEDVPIYRAGLLIKDQKPASKKPANEVLNTYFVDKTVFFEPYAWLVETVKGLGLHTSRRVLPAFAVSLESSTGLSLSVRDFEQRASGLSMCETELECKSRAVI